MFQKQRWKELVNLSMPLVVSKLSFTMMGIVDTAMIGHLGASQQAAAGFAVVYLFTLYVFGLGLVTSVNTLVSQYDGAGERDKCADVLWSGLLLALIVGIVVWSIMLGSRPVFDAMGMSLEVSSYGFTYLYYRSFGVLSVFGYWVFNSFYEGLGKTRTPMYVTIVANLMNIGLDYLFIYGGLGVPAMGLKGAGIATAMSNGFMFVVLLMLAFRRRSALREYVTASCRVSKAMLKKMMRLGIPMGAQMFLEVGAFFVFTTIVGWAGDVELAASQIAMRIMSVTFMTAWGVSIAATTLVGRHQGAQRPDLAQKAVLRALLLIGVVGLVMAAVVMVLARQITGLFTPFEDVSQVVINLMLVAAVFTVFDGLNVVSYGALRGAGDTTLPLWYVAIMHWVVGVPLVYYLTISLGMGAYGNWLGMAIMMTVQALLMYLRVHGGKWKSIDLVNA